MTFDLIWQPRRARSASASSRFELRETNTHGEPPGEVLGEILSHVKASFASNNIAHLHPYREIIFAINL